MRDLAALVFLLVVITVGLCYVGVLTPEQVRAGLAGLLLALARIVEG